MRRIVAIGSSLFVFACGQTVVPTDPLSRDQLVTNASGALEYRRPSWCAPCAPCDCTCADPIGSAPRTEHVLIGNDDSTAAPSFRATLTTPYWLGRHELTVRCFELCRVAGVCAPIRVRAEIEDRVRLPARADHPAIQLTLDAARAACRFFGGRLPTSVQWEFAARGTDGRPFPWGASLDCARGNFATLPGGMLCRFDVDAYPPVGSFPSGAGPFGTLDLAGSVNEWVEDTTVSPNWYRAQRALNDRGIEPVDPVGQRVPDETPVEPFQHGMIRSDGINVRHAWILGGPIDQPPFNEAGDSQIGLRCLWDRDPSRR